MAAEITAEIFVSFIFGAAALVGGGMLFEGGKRYVKTGRSNQFRGKIEAIPFFFGVLTLGFALKQFEPLVESIVYTIPVLSRVGFILLVTMFLFNYSVDNFNYADEKPVPVYLIGAGLLIWPFI